MDMNTSENSGKEKYMARAHTPDLTAQRLSADSLKDCQFDGGM